MSRVYFPKYKNENGRTCKIVAHICTPYEVLIQSILGREKQPRTFRPELPLQALWEFYFHYSPEKKHGKYKILFDPEVKYTPKPPTEFVPKTVHVLSINEYFRHKNLPVKLDRISGLFHYTDQPRPRLPEKFVINQIEEMKVN